MRRSHARALCAALLIVCGTPRAQPPVVELDHVLVVVPARPDAQIAALRAAGFVVDTALTRPEGQGTASVSVLFENAYLELLWVDAAVSVSECQRAELEGFRGAAAWEATGESPFGFGLRRADTSGVDLGVPTRPYSAAWMEPGTHIDFVTGSDEPAASELFVVPPYMAASTWMGWIAEHRPDLLRHASGARRITRAAVRGSASQEPRGFRALRPAGVAFVPDGETVLEIEVDGGRGGERTDLRPHLPVVFIR